MLVVLFLFVVVAMWGKTNGGHDDKKRTKKRTEKTNGEKKQKNNEKNARKIGAPVGEADAD